MSSPRVRRVVASTAVDNVPSRRALERAGFAAVADDGETVSYARQR